VSIGLKRDLVPKLLSEHCAVFDGSKSEEALRIESLGALGTYFEAITATKSADFLAELDETAELLSALVALFAAPSEKLQVAAGATVDKLVKAIKKESYPRFVPVVRQKLAEIDHALPGPPETHTVPGFNLPMGLAPLVPLFLTSLMNVAAATSGDDELEFNPHEMREQAASGLGDLVRLTSVEALKPFIINISGPLIRIVGDRFPPDVKAAILRTLGLLLEKGEAKLKPFLPQLQTTFVKSLHDTSRVVRGLATAALGKLVSLGSRIDPLLSEVLGGLTGDLEVIDTLLATLV
jgi:hypothetical protein